MAGAAGAFVRILLHPVVASVSRLLLDLTVRGSSHLPRRGPALIVSNHQGYLDPVFLQMGTVRPVRYLMTADFYDVRAAQPFFRLAGALRIREGAPNLDTLRTTLGLLRAGEIVGVFPEGRLSTTGAIGALEPGAAFLAAKSGAPVVPARIEGSIEVLPKGRVLPRRARVSVRFGPPFRVASPRDEARIAEALSSFGEPRRVPPVYSGSSS